MIHGPSPVRKFYLNRSSQHEAPFAQLTYKNSRRLYALTVLHSVYTHASIKVFGGEKGVEPFTSDNPASLPLDQLPI
jgi:hypothetical protein